MPHTRCGHTRFYMLNHNISLDDFPTIPAWPGEIARWKGLWGSSPGALGGLEVEGLLYANMQICKFGVPKAKQLLTLHFQFHGVMWLLMLVVFRVPWTSSSQSSSSGFSKCFPASCGLGVSVSYRLSFTAGRVLKVTWIFKGCHHSIQSAACHHKMCHDVYKHKPLWWSPCKIGSCPPVNQGIDWDRPGDSLD